MPVTELTPGQEVPVWKLPPLEDESALPVFSPSEPASVPAGELAPSATLQAPDVQLTQPKIERLKSHPVAMSETESLSFSRPQSADSLLVGFFAWQAPPMLLKAHV